MNEAVMIDTREAFKDFHEAGFTEKQTEVVVNLVNGVATHRDAELVSKRDLAELETRLTKFMVVVGAIAVSVVVSVVVGVVVAATVYMANIVTDALTKLN